MAGVSLATKAERAGSTGEQQAALAKWVSETLPRTTAVVGEWIEKTYGISYTRSAIIKLLKRMGMEYRKPKAVPRKLDLAKQATFIRAYNDLLNNLADDEAVMFADAVHPTHEARPADVGLPKAPKLLSHKPVVATASTFMVALILRPARRRCSEVLTVNAESTIALLMAIMIMYPAKRLIHVFLDNAKYHHAEMVQEWLARPECRIRLHFIPTTAPTSIPSSDYGA